MIEWLFETGINLIETFMLVEFLTEYLGCKYQGKRRNICFLLCWMVVFLELCVVNSITVLESWSIYIPIILYFIYALFCLNGSISMKLWMSLVTQILVTAIAQITIIFVCNLIGYDSYALITVFNSTRVTGVVFSKILLFYTMRILLKHKQKSQVVGHTWAMLIITPVISLISLWAASDGFYGT